MPYKNVEKHEDKQGSDYWGSGRIQKMVREKDLKSEKEVLVLFNKISSEVNSVIDLGCGIGRRHVHFPGVRYVGVDREKVMVDKGGEIFPDLMLYRCDLMDLSDEFPQFKKVFDLAFTFHVVQYNNPEEQAEIFNNIHAVLKTGGYYYMKENEGDCPRELVPKDKFETLYTENPHGHTIFKKLGV